MSLPYGTNPESPLQKAIKRACSLQRLVSHFGTKQKKNIYIYLALFIFSKYRGPKIKITRGVNGHDVTRGVSGQCLETKR